MKKPLVSVICTNYNKGEWIGDAIESFLMQETDFDFDIFIIDDKSTDGSEAIVRKYSEIYPDKIKAIFNEENMGITKTWLKIVDISRGKYIARCDGDDFWTDSLKLQKQVDLLEGESGKWCSTDYDIVDGYGARVVESAYKSGATSRVNNFEDMLVTQGFTIPSSWMVDANLMKRVNSIISTEAIDDTFNIQLELLKVTKLLFLDESTVAYRMAGESDSRPIDIETVIKRSELLFETQVEFIDKYKDSDMRQMLIKSLEIISRLNPILYDNKTKIDNLNRRIHMQEVQIQKRDEAIQEMGIQLRSIVGSKKYRLATLMSRPIEIARRLRSRGEV